MPQPSDTEERPGCCPCCGYLLVPSAAEVTHGYWSLAGGAWGMSLRHKCPECAAELIAHPGNQKRWEGQVPALVVWFRF